MSYERRMDRRERTLLAVILPIFALGCTNDAPPPLVSATPVLTHPVEPVGDASADASSSRDGSTVDGGADVGDAGVVTDGATAASEDGLSPDFLAWLDSHGYQADDFARRDLGSPASFGGKIQTLPGTGKRPVVFVHGNSDRAIGGSYGGWSKPRAAFRAAGYAPSELYATTWGPGDPNQASSQTHRASYLGRVRRFLDAVLAYTASDRVTVISHSMGVTLARRAIQGGLYRDEAGATVDLGAPLGGKVAVFVGLAGANYGLSSCYLAAAAPTPGFSRGKWSVSRSWGAPASWRRRTVAPIRRGATSSRHGPATTRFWAAADSSGARRRPRFPGPTRSARSTTAPSDTSKSKTTLAPGSSASSTVDRNGGNGHSASGTGANGCAEASVGA